MLRPTVSWKFCVGASTHLGLKIFFCLTVAGLLMWGAHSDERTGLSFTMYSVQYYILHVMTVMYDIVLCKASVTPGSIQQIVPNL
jgi:tryptophan-rich sensory protein